MTLLTILISHLLLSELLTMENFYLNESLRGILEPLQEQLISKI